jgi:hypothetical protein
MQNKPSSPSLAWCLARRRTQASARLEHRLGLDTDVVADDATARNVRLGTYGGAAGDNCFFYYSSRANAHAFPKDRVANDRTGPNTRPLS